MTPAPYKPADDRALGAFERQWCVGCASWPADDLACPVWARAQAYAPGQPNFPAAWITDDDGPRCIAFVNRGAIPSPIPIADALHERRA